MINFAPIVTGQQKQLLWSPFGLSKLVPGVLCSGRAFCSGTRLTMEHLGGNQMCWKDLDNLGGKTEK